MNERILSPQLLNLVQAAGPGYSQADPEWVKKFAELIIQECVNVAKNPQWYSKNPSNDWRNPINHVCNAMKEHFGVEE